MIETYNSIIDRLQQSIDRPSIYKIFTYSLIEIQEDPDRLKEIADYLKKFKGSYEEFRIHSWVDPETMKPVIMLELTLNEELRKSMKPIGNLLLNYYKKQNNI